MAESREQFRDRIAEHIDIAWSEAFRTPEERSPWDLVRPEWKEAMADVAEAVYTAALRDVRQHWLNMPSDTWRDDEIIGYINRHAASLGIDLDDAP